MNYKRYQMHYEAEELEPCYDNRKSFYGKAQQFFYEDGTIELQSYSTIVARIEDGKAIVYGWYSNTTGRHIKEFLKQHGFWADNKAQILKDYGEVE